MGDGPRSSFRRRAAARLACLCGAAALLALPPVSAVAGDHSAIHVPDEMFLTRTTAPAPSPELARALELDVPEWHRNSDSENQVPISEDAVRRSTEAALEALNALPPEAMRSDFDRAWVAYEKGSALRGLGRDAEARAAFEGLLGMPHTVGQDRQVRAQLHDLGDEAQPVFCQQGQAVRSAAGSAPEYPRAASARGIEGWVLLMIDAAQGGAITSARVQTSSMRIFEQPAAEWLLGQRVQGESGAAVPACFALIRVDFKLEPQARFTIDAIRPERAGFTYRSIGAAIRIRRAAREAVLGAS